MNRQENIERRHRGRGQLRSPLGVPVSCEIYVEPDSDGVPVILSSIEIESGGEARNRILSQSPVDGEEVLRIYRNWRTRSENQDRIRRVYLEDLTDLPE